VKQKVPLVGNKFRREIDGKCNDVGSGAENKQNVAEDL
jgi:hypothetical protein